MNKTNKTSKSNTSNRPYLTIGQIDYAGGTTLYVSGLKYSLKAKDIKIIFQAYGEVNYVNIVTNKDTGLNRGIAFVQMMENSAAKEAILALNEIEHEGRTLKVSIAKEQPKVRARTVNIQARKAAFKEGKKIEKAEQAASAKAANEKPKDPSTKTTPARSRRKRDKGLKILFNHLNS
jgi:RNA recognition motif-containing protein